MLIDNEPPDVNLLIGIPAPLLSFTVKDTTGFAPAAPITFTSVTLMPGRVREEAGIVCAPMMEASNSSSPCGIWHPAHCLSSTCGRLTWLRPDAKLMLEWQAPQTGPGGGGSQAVVLAAAVFGLWEG